MRFGHEQIHRRVDVRRQGNVRPWTTASLRPVPVQGRDLVLAVMHRWHDGTVFGYEHVYQRILRTEGEWNAVQRRRHRRVRVGILR